MSSPVSENAATPVVLLVPVVLIAWTRRHHNADLPRRRS